MSDSAAHKLEQTASLQASEAYGGIAVFPRSSDNDFSRKKQVLELALLSPPEVSSDIHLLAFRTRDALRLYAKERGALMLEAAALNRLAAVAWLQSWDFATAHALLNESLLLVEATGDAAAIAETEWNLGQIAHWAGVFTLHPESNL